MNSISLLKNFLEYPLYTSKPIFDKFKSLDNAIYREGKNKYEKFCYIEGKRKDKVVLVAHVDTVFKTTLEHHVKQFDDYFISETKSGERCGLGADDRAGVAILWHLRNSGHSLLITDGEEISGIGSEFLMFENQYIADKINQHQFMIQFDRRGATDFKTYNVGTVEFINFIKKEIGYNHLPNSSYTDICTLCKDICGVNFSVGYYNEHTKQEEINIKEWENTLKVVSKLINKNKLPKFNLKWEDRLWV